MMAQVKLVKTKGTRWLGNGCGEAPADWSVRVNGSERARLIGHYNYKPRHRVEFNDDNDAMAWQAYLRRNVQVRTDKATPLKAAIREFFASLHFEVVTDSDYYPLLDEQDG